MAKYIDADRLKAKLDEYYRNYQSKYMETRTPYTQGLIDALDLAEQVIDYFQQEQPEVDLEEEIKKYCMDYYNCNYPDQIQNGRCSPVMPHIVEAARHFAEWQKKQMMSEAVEGRIEEVSFNNGELHNTIFFSFDEESLHVENRIWFPRCGKDGDKVRIIIVKEDEK